MNVTMKEKLIAAAIGAADYRTDIDGNYRVIDNWAEIVDAILSQLQEPDEGMVRAGDESDYESQEGIVVSRTIGDDGIANVFAAMIGHVKGACPDRTGEVDEAGGG